MAGDVTTQPKQGRQAMPISSLCILLCLFFPFNTSLRWKWGNYCCWKTDCLWKARMTGIPGTIEEMSWMMADWNIKTSF